MPGLPGKMARDIHAYVHKVDDRCADKDTSRTSWSSRASPAPASRRPWPCFEDAGYFCVDNLPPEMIGSLAELFDHEGSKVERAAVVCDARGGELLRGPGEGAGRAEAPRRALPPAVPRGLRRDAGQPLQGDAPAPPAGRTAARWTSAIAARARAARAAARARRRVASTPPTCQRRAPAQGGGRQDAAARQRSAGSRSPSSPRLQARRAARRRPAPSTCASCPTRTTSPSCAR